MTLTLRKYVSWFTGSALVLLFGCAQRDADMGDRNNQWDPNGTTWTENALPEITTDYTAYWLKYDHTNQTGSLKLTVTASDLNFPYDTLNGNLLINAEIQKLPKMVTEDSVTCTVNNLRPDTTYQCSTLVYDVKSDTVITVVPIATNWGIPKKPPEWRVEPDTNSLIFSWDRVAEVDTYCISVIYPKIGTVGTKAKIKQPDSSRVVTRVATYSSTVESYVLSVIDEFGIAYSTDTIQTRPFIPALQPRITQITKGSKTKLVTLSLRIQSPFNVSYLSILRATNADGPYDPLDTILINYSNATSLFTSYETLPNQATITQYNYIYLDSVPSTGVFYYKAVAFDSIGQCSRLTAPDSGFAMRTTGPLWYSITSEPDRIKLEWDKVTNATHYRIYRSAASCASGKELIGSTTAVLYVDIPPTSDTYYYVVTSVDKDSFESAFSSCQPAKVSILLPPKLTVSKSLYLDHITITWNSIPGADGYILYKADSLLNYLPYDTLTDTTFNDSLFTPGRCYYSVAGFNQKGLGAISAFDFGSIIFPDINNPRINADTVTLAWYAEPRALMYYIYRGKDRLNFNLLDSTTTSSYKHIITDYGYRYYRITMKLPEGITTYSYQKSVDRPVPAPLTIMVKDSTTGTQLNWSAVKGATSYEVYRLQGTEMVKYAETVDTFFYDSAVSTSRQTYQITSRYFDLTSDKSRKVTGGIIQIPLTPISLSQNSQVFSIKLTWYKNEASSTPDGFHIFRALDTNGNYILIDSTREYFFDDSVPDTLVYYYRISAYNNLGESPLSTVVAGARRKPAAPQTVTASFATSKAHIQITWSAVPSVKDFIIYRALQPTDTHVAIGTASNRTTYFDSTCSVNIRYSYLVCSVVPGNRSRGSASATGYRLGPPELTQLSYVNSGIQLEWRSLPFTVTNYTVYRSSATTGTFVKIGTSTSTSFFDTSPLSGTNAYKVSATTTVESDLSVTLTGQLLDKSLPAPPANLTATMGTVSGRVVLTWNRTTNVAGYRIYRAPTDTFNRGISVVGETSDSTFSDTVSSDSMYYYSVRAFNSWGESGFSGTPASGYRFPTLKPAPPPQLYIWPHEGTVDVSWYRPTTAVGFNGYNIYRCASNNGTFEFVGTASTTTYSDIPPGSDLLIYWYYVTTKNQAGESVPSGKISGSELK